MRRAVAALDSGGRLMAGARLTERFLLLVSVAGDAKRVAVADVPVTKRGRVGVRVSFEPLAAAVVLSVADEVVIASRAGMIERVAAADVPVMGRRARGVRVITLGPGDQVAKVALVPRTPSELHPGGVCGPATDQLDLGHRVALTAGEVALIIPREAA